VPLNFMTGRYHQSRLEERIFLFIDMEDSTGLAELLRDRERRYECRDVKAAKYSF
jgi:hypothetical protein